MENISDKQTKHNSENHEQIAPGGAKIMNNEVRETTWRRLVPEVAPGISYVDQNGSE